MTKKVKIDVDGKRVKIHVPDNVWADESLRDAYIEQAHNEIRLDMQGKAAEKQEPPAKEKSIWERASDIVETGAVVGSSVLANAAGGLAAAGSFAKNAVEDYVTGDMENRAPGQYWWENSLNDAVGTQEAVTNALTYKTDDQGVQENLEAISNSIVGDAGRAYDSATDSLSEKALEATGSPWIAGIAKAAPDAALELVGAGVATRGARAASRQVNRSDIKTLQDAGVSPTVGQKAGGALKNIEDRAEGVVPGVRSAHDRNLADWQNGVINKSLEPLGVKVEGTGVEAIEQAQKALDDAYDAARDVMPDLQVSGTNLAADLAEQLNDTAKAGLDVGVIDSIKKIYEDIISPLTKREKISSSDLQLIESKLNSQIAKATASGRMDMAIELRQFLQILREQAAKQSPEYAEKVGKANAAYSRFADVELAAGRAGGEAGEFTPAQLQAAVKQGTSRREKARGGDGEIAELASAGKNVLMPKVNNSGTGERVGQFGVGGAFLSDPLIGAATLGTLYGGSTRAGQAIGRGMLNVAPYTLPVAGAGLFSVPLLAAGNDYKEN